MVKEVRYKIYEQETIIRYDVQDKKTYIYSNYPVDVRRFLNLEGTGVTIISKDTDEDGNVTAVDCVLNEGYNLSRKPSKKRVMSDEQRAEAAARLAKYRDGGSDE